MYENDELFRQCDVDTDVQIALSEVLPMDKSGRLIRPGDMMVVDDMPIQAMAVGDGFFMSKMPDGEWRSFDSKNHLNIWRLLRDGMITAARVCRCTGIRAR